MSKKIERIGEINESKKCGPMVILEYNNTGNIKIKFLETETVQNTSYINFKKGMVRDPMCKNIVGIGCLGIGEYKPTTNGKMNRYYRIWNHMLDRCVINLNRDCTVRDKSRTYRDVVVCEEWLNFCKMV